jgi:N-acetylneuraminic acid mutarotase
LAHQVFVSYATEDAEAAFRVCTLLEGEGIPCWIAPRNVKAGTDYAAAIVGAIRNSQVVVLVFSTHSNASPYALREIERSVAYGRPVLALRMDKADPSASLEYYLHHWLDASEGLESARPAVIPAIREQLAQCSTAAPGAGRGALSVRRPPVKPAAVGNKARKKTRSWYIRTSLVVAAAVVVVAGLGLGLGLGLSRSNVLPPAGAASDRISWTELQPAPPHPLARDFHSMAYDKTNAWLVLFGGSSETGPLNDTWAFDPGANTWTELKPSGGLPAARWAHAIAYDPVTRKVIMFGGRAESGPSLNDTWVYDPVANTWTEAKPTGPLPLPRRGAAMACDPATRKVIMFGGNGDAGALDDTWAYDSATNAWAKLEPHGTSPSARGEHSMAYDPVGRQLMVFGGRSDTGATLGDTWAYDPVANTWTESRFSGARPSARSRQSMGYDLAGARMIIFGGQDVGGESLGDAWAYDSAADTWTRLEPSVTQPSARAGQVMVEDPAHGQLIVFGGHSSGPDDYLNETWAFTVG